MQGFFEELFTGCVGSDSRVPIKILIAHRVGNVGKRKEILRCFSGVCGLGYKDYCPRALWDKPKIVVEGQELAIFSDVCNYFKEETKITISHC